MNIFEQISNNIKEISDNLDMIGVSAMMDESDTIIDTNVDQLEHGINSEGDFVGEYESEDYKALKKSMGSKAPYGKVDTKVIGDFHSGIYMKDIGGGKALIDSHDDKTPMLERKYDNLFGIAPKNVPEIGGQLIDNIQNTIIDEIIRT